MQLVQVQRHKGLGINSLLRLSEESASWRTTGGVRTGVVIPVSMWRPSFCGRCNQRNDLVANVRQVINPTK
jgi:hypothetical protein